jgi:hypothetical protein
MSERYFRAVPLAMLTSTGAPLNGAEAGKSVAPHPLRLLDPDRSAARSEPVLSRGGENAMKAELTLRDDWRTGNVAQPSRLQWLSTRRQSKPQIAQIPQTGTNSARIAGGQSFRVWAIGAISGSMPSWARQRLGLRLSPAAFGCACPDPKRQKTGALQNLAEIRANSRNESTPSVADFHSGSGGTPGLLSRPLPERLPNAPLPANVSASGTGASRSQHYH